MYKICARARSAAILPLWGGAKKLLRSAPDQSATFVTAPIAAAAEPTPTPLAQRAISSTGAAAALYPIYLPPRFPRRVPTVSPQG